MSYYKVLDIAKKFADSQNESQKFEDQRIKVNKFFGSFIIQLRTIINEMESDINTLKYRGFDGKILNMLIKLWNNLISYYHSINKQSLKDSEIYILIGKIVDFILNRNNLAIIDNINFLAQDFMKKNQIDLIKSEIIKESKIRSLKELRAIIYSAKEYMQQNPLLSIPGNLELPKMDEPDSYQAPKLGPADITIIPGKK